MIQSVFNISLLCMGMTRFWILLLANSSLRLTHMKMTRQVADFSCKHVQNRDLLCVPVFASHQWERQSSRNRRNQITAKSFIPKVINKAAVTCLWKSMLWALPVVCRKRGSIFRSDYNQASTFHHFPEETSNISKERRLSAKGFFACSRIRMYIYLYLWLCMTCQLDGCKAWLTI